jgi:hypothetical protein
MSSASLPASSGKGSVLRSWSGSTNSRSSVASRRLPSGLQLRVVLQLPRERRLQCEFVHERSSRSGSPDSVGATDRAAEQPVGGGTLNPSFAATRTSASGASRWGARSQSSALERAPVRRAVRKRGKSPTCRVIAGGFDRIRFGCLSQKLRRFEAVRARPDGAELCPRALGKRDLQLKPSEMWSAFVTFGHGPRHRTRAHNCGYG